MHRCALSSTGIAYDSIAHLIHGADRTMVAARLVGEAPRGCRLTTISRMVRRACSLGDRIELEREQQWSMEWCTGVP